MLSKEISKKLDEVINTVKDSKEYKNCIDIKKQMDNNIELKKMIEEVKRLQKEYIRTNDINIKDKLDREQEKLNSIPIYREYNNNLEVVNQMINFIKEELNEYFYNKLNRVE